jgi:SOS-response transcriptional repressor, lexA
MEVERRQKMSEDDYKRIFARNLNHYLAINQKSQIDIIHDLGMKRSSVSNWCAGISLPRMDKVQALADYFNINKSDLLEEKPVKFSVEVTRNSGNVSNSISDKSSTVSNYYSSAEKCQSKQEITANSKTYFFTLLDNLKEMTDGEILEMIEYAKYLLSRRKE